MINPELEPAKILPLGLCEDTDRPYFVVQSDQRLADIMATARYINRFPTDDMVWINTMLRGAMEVREERKRRGGDDCVPSFMRDLSSLEGLSDAIIHLHGEEKLQEIKIHILGQAVAYGLLDGVLVRGNFNEIRVATDESIADEMATLTQQILGEK